ncbi:MAG TPA: DUF885 domain-containing protein [Thermoplasmata archaeon]|nr:DUF885 domain-containing protein [Thermoplasmata archaeon]
MDNRDFPGMCRTIVDEILSWDPSYSTQLGWRKYDHLMMDPSMEARDHRVERLSEFMRMVGKFKDAELEPDHIIDRDLAMYMFRLREFEISRLRIPEQMSIAEDEIGRSLFFLFVRDDQPFDVRARALISRLEKTPAFLEAARRTLVRPYRMWTELALTTGKELPSLLELIKSVAAMKLTSDEVMMRLSGATADAQDAIVAYERWLFEEVLPEAHDENTITAEDFEEYMQLKEFGVTADEALEVGDIGLKMADKQRLKVAKELSPSGKPSDAIRKMKEDHPPTFEGALKSYREWIESARDFVISNGLATIPNGEKLLVIETPQFMRRQMPFAAQYEPGKYSGCMTGLFLVTPHDSNLQLLMEHNHASIANTSVHEGYPGHHLQGICSNQNPSDIRTISASPCFGEGWALYCENMMFEKGFQNSQLGKLAQLNDLVFRIVRVRADVGLARKTMTPEEVAALLVKETGMDEGAALDDAKSYTYGMTYYMSYFIGMLEMLRLREEVESALGERFDLREFHDSLLYAGCLPMHFMRRVEALRLKRDYGVDLPDSKETLLEFIRRRSSEGMEF